MKSFLSVSVLIGSLLISSVSFAQDGGRGRDRGRSEQERGRDRDRDERNENPGRGSQSSFQDYAGAIGQGNYCTTCAFENRADVPRSGSRKGNERYLVNNDRESINARCRELGWDRGQALEWFTYQEWCGYGNARTRTYDRYSRRWTYGRCTDGNVKLARCFSR